MVFSLYLIFFLIALKKEKVAGFSRNGNTRSDQRAEDRVFDFLLSVNARHQNKDKIHAGEDG